MTATTTVIEEKEDCQPNEEEPFTIVALKALKKTPDIMLKRTESEGGGLDVTANGNGISIPAEYLTDAMRSGDTQRLYGQCMDPDWFTAAGGVDAFRNAIVSSVKASERISSLFGVVSDAREKGSDKYKQFNLAVVYAEWSLDRAKKLQEAVSFNGDQRLKVAAAARLEAAEENYNVSKSLAARFWGDYTVKITPEYAAYYMLEPYGLERECIMGDKCVGRQTLYHPLADGNGIQKGKVGSGQQSAITASTNDTPPAQIRVSGYDTTFGRESGTENATMTVTTTAATSAVTATATGSSVTAEQITEDAIDRKCGITLKEFLTPAERERLDKFGELPAERNMCILCQRFECTFEYYLSILGIAKWCVPPHEYPIEVQGGYKRTACLQPQKTGTRGAIVPTRPFVTNEYVPSTIDEMIAANAVSLTASEMDRLKKCGASFANSLDKKFEKDGCVTREFLGKNGIPKVRGYVELGHVRYYEHTKHMTSQALANGTEPCSTYIGALATRIYSNETESSSSRRMGQAEFDRQPHYKQQQQQQYKLANEKKECLSEESRIIEKEGGGGVIPSEEFKGFVLNGRNNINTQPPSLYTRLNDFNFDVSVSGTNIPNRDDHSTTPRSTENHANNNITIIDTSSPTTTTTTTTIDIKAEEKEKENRETKTEIESAVIEKNQEGGGEGEGEEDITSSSTAATSTQKTYKEIPKSRKFHDRVSCCEHEHAGSWTYLALEFASRIVITEDTVKILLGPFCALCEVVRNALEFADSVLSIKPNMMHGMLDGQDTATKLEIAAMARRLRLWTKTPVPIPMSQHVVLIACFMRHEAMEDVRSSIDMDIVEIARYKSTDKKTKEEANAMVALPQKYAYETWEELLAAHRMLELDVTATSDSDHQKWILLESLRSMVTAGQNTWLEEKRTARLHAAEKAKTMHESKIAPFTPPTASQMELMSRIKKLCTWATSSGLTRTDGSIKTPPEDLDIASKRKLTLFGLIRERQKKRPSQKTLDRLVGELDRFELSQKPLREMLIRIKNSGYAIDDFTLIGRPNYRIYDERENQTTKTGLSDVTTAHPSAPVFCKSSLGHYDPDSFVSELPIPRKPVRLSLSPSTTVMTCAAIERFEKSGLPAHSIPPTPASFSIPDIPTCRVKFMSHRVFLLEMITTGKIPGLSFDTPIHQIIVSVLNAKDIPIPQTIKDAVTGKQPFPTIGVLMDEFWKSMAVLRNAHEIVVETLLDACGDFSTRILGPLSGGKAEFAFRRPFTKKCSMLATALARLVIADFIQYNDDITYRGDVIRYRANTFAWTHGDLLGAINWTVNDGWCDEVLEMPIRHGTASDNSARQRNEHIGKNYESRQSDYCLPHEYSIGHAISIASENYPFDTRAITEEDMVPMAAEMSACRFFEQTSELESKSLEHILKKVVPRACEKRACDNIMDQTASVCPAFATWFIGTLECTMKGAYPHAKVRPSVIDAMVTCKPFIEEAKKDMKLRIIEAELRPFARKRLRKSTTMKLTLVPLSRGQISACIALADLLDITGTCVGIVTNKSVDKESYNTGASAIMNVISNSIAKELTRRLISEFKYITIDLAALVQIVSKYIKRIMEEVRQQDGTCRWSAPLQDIHSANKMIASMFKTKSIRIQTPAATTNSDETVIKEKDEEEDSDDDDDETIRPSEENIWNHINNIIAETENGGLSERVFDTVLINFENEKIKAEILSMMAKKKKKVEKNAKKFAEISAEAAVLSVIVKTRDTLIRKYKYSKTVSNVSENIARAVRSIMEKSYKAAMKFAGITTAFANEREFFDKFEHMMCSAIRVLSISGNADEAVASVRTHDGKISSLKMPSCPITGSLVSEVCESVYKIVAGEEQKNRLYMKDCHPLHFAHATEILNTAMIDALKRGLTTLDESLFSGISDKALLALSVTAGDIFDVWNNAVNSSAEPRGRQAMENVVNAAAIILRGICSDTTGSELVKTELGKATKTIEYREELDKDTEKLEAIRMALLKGVVTLRKVASDTKLLHEYVHPHTNSKMAHDAETSECIGEDDSMDSMKLLATTGRLVAELIGMMGKIAGGAIKYADSRTKNELLRKDWERYSLVKEKLSNVLPVAIKDAFLCQFAIRESVMAQMSRNPALFATFVTRGNWFTVFADHVLTTCDDIRSHIVRTKKIPTNEETSVISSSIDKTAWNNKTTYTKVYRLRRHDIATHIVKMAELHETAILKSGAEIGPAFSLGKNRVDLLRAYTSAIANSDRRPDPDRDIDTLWQFGMRDHGLAIIAKLHAAHEHYGGKSEFSRIMTRMTVTEFLLALEYYKSLASANSVSVIPFRSASISESVAMAIRAKSGMWAGKIPLQLLSLVVCDICMSVLTQLPDRFDTKQSKLTSCCYVIAGPNGELACLDDKRKSVKKKPCLTAQQQRNSKIATTTTRTSNSNEEEGDKSQQLVHMTDDNTASRETQIRRSSSTGLSSPLPKKRRRRSCIEQKRSTSTMIESGMSMFFLFIHFLFMFFYSISTYSKNVS
jgi:hypothetical protein